MKRRRYLSLFLFKFWEFFCWWKFLPVKSHAIKVDSKFINNSSLLPKRCISQKPTKETLGHSSTLSWSIFGPTTLLKIEYFMDPLSYPPFILKPSKSYPYGTCEEGILHIFPYFLVFNDMFLYHQEEMAVNWL